MASEEQGNGGNRVIKIKGSLSAYEVAALKDQIQLGLENATGLTLDVDGVTNCDTLGVQLLYSAGKTARKLNKPVSISGRSEACWKAALAIGLDPEDYLNS